MPLEIFSVDTDRPPELREPAESGFQIHRYRLSEGKQAGCDLIIVNSQGVCAAICPTRGMSLWRAKLDGVDCQWGSPVHGPVHPCWVPLSEPSGLGWLDGFDELLVRCGLRSFGAPDFDDKGKLLCPLHGSIGNLAAEYVEVNLSQDGKRLTISGDVYETRFLLYSLRLRVQYEFNLGQQTILVRDEVTNVGGSSTAMQMLYHINYGKPVLSAGCQFHVAAHEIVARDARAVEDLATWDRYLGPTRGYSEQVYFMQPIADASGWATTMLSNPAGQAIAVHYRAATLPYFTLWKNTACEETGYVTGLEPGTGFPNPHSFEKQKGRLVTLEPQASQTFELKLEASRSSTRIEQLKQQIHSLQDSAQPMLTGFRPDWCTPRAP